MNGHQKTDTNSNSSNNSNDNNNHNNNKNNNNDNANNNVFLDFESSVKIDAEWADPWLKSLVFQCEGDYS